MSFYSEKILPLFYNFSMGRESITKGRKRVLKNASGNVLEIGFGTGLNLPHYPSSVKKITTVDKNSGMNKQAQKLINKSKIEVDNKVLNSESLPFEAQTFDTVVSTYTLCSISNINSALSEIYRVLKSHGKFIFHEHGLSEDDKIRKWQNRLNPFQKIFADGCHLNRNFEALLGNTGFRLIEINKFYMDGPKTHSFMFEGIAVRKDYPA